MTTHSVMYWCSRHRQLNPGTTCPKCDDDKRDVDVLRAELATVKAQNNLLIAQRDRAITELYTVKADFKARMDKALIVNESRLDELTRLREMCMENETQTRWATEALEKVKAETVGLRRVLGEQMARAEKAEAELTRLRGYVQHKPECKVRWSVDAACTCGLRGERIVDRMWKFCPECGTNTQAGCEHTAARPLIEQKGDA